MPAWLPETAFGGEAAGRTVAIDGDTAVVGGHGTGSLFVYERSGGQWSYLQTLADPNPPGGWVPYQVAISGDVIVLGSPHDSTLAPGAGAAHIFEREGDSWSLAETLYDPNATEDANFGYAVGVDGQFMGVSAPHHVDGDAGRVYVYLRSIDEWLFWDTVGGLTQGSLGLSLAVREMENSVGVQMAIGVPNWDVPNENAGLVGFHTRELGEFGSLNFYQPPALSAFDWFGTDVAFDDTTLLIGAMGDDTLGAGVGAAYTYEIEPVDYNPALTQADKLLPCGEIDFLNYGQSVDAHDGRLAVGTSGPGAIDMGSVYVYRPGAFGGWQVEDRVQGSVAGDQFGWDVALGNEGLLAGASGLDTAGANSGGAYYVSLVPGSIDGGECPCEQLASMATYGTGKAGSAGVPELAAGSPPVPGDLTLVTLKNALVGAAPFLIWGLTPAAIPLDEGTLLVGDLNLALLPVVGVLGQVGIGWNVPAQPALCGLDVYLQGMFLDPGAGGPYHTAQTNGLKLTVGY